jgi:hypothetical protein
MAQPSTPQKLKVLSLAMAHKAFESNSSADPALRVRFEQNVQAFLSLADPLSE